MKNKINFFKDFDLNSAKLEDLEKLTDPLM